MQEMITVHPAVVHGQEIAVQVGPGGEWRAEYAGKTLQAPDRQHLLRKLAAEGKKTIVKISVPFTMISGPSVRHGTVYGRHAGNGNLLVKWDGGEMGQIGKMSYNQVFTRRLDAEQTDRMIRLRRALRTAQEELSEFERKVRIDLGKAVEDAAAAEAARVR